ncbi:hypothetical protein KI387_005609, partial [Taxus chinensis]
MEVVIFVAGHVRDAAKHIANGVAEGARGILPALKEQGKQFKYDVQTEVISGFDIPMFLTGVALFAAGGVAAVGTTEVSLQMASNFICKRRCNTCNGWEALRCTRCRGTGKVKYRVMESELKDGEKYTINNLAVAIANGRAKIMQYPASLDTELLFPSEELPTKECPTCDASGVMGCPECKRKFKYRISTDDLCDLPRKSWDVLRKIEYPSEHILESMEDPILAAYWLIAKPELEGGFKFDEDVKQKLWWTYKEEFLRYETVRKSVAEQEPGWEHMQKVLLTIDPSKAREDPVFVKNVPYYKARKKIKDDVMKLEVPRRPDNWGVSNLPLKETDQTEDELKDPRKQYHIDELLSRQKKVAEDILDSAWEMKWRRKKYDELVEKRVQKVVSRIKQ